MAMILPRVPKIKPNARDITKEYLERNNINDDCIDNVTVNQIVKRNISTFEEHSTKETNEWERLNDWEPYPLNFHHEVSSLYKGD
jgi:hypothetical protein|tara:strand:- start:16 stop:270 length:255 start_codon:yes stop_codon:yes gene_type:complete